MGLFDKLLSKKECDFCGGEIGLFGNRKLEDGNMCKECAQKLSPWFSDRRSSTVAEIKEQLEYREANREKVAAFRTTRTLGDSMKILLDEDAGTFMVTDQRNLQEANPDVLAFSDVTGCVLDIDEDRTEIMREDRDGNEISYNPPRYTYEYDFYITIQVRNPYFDEIRFRLNDSTVEIEQNQAVRMGMGGPGGRAPGMNRMPGGPGMNRMGAGPGMGHMAGSINPEMNIEYRRYREMGEEIRAALLQIRQQTRDEAVAAAAPKAAVTCPYCGATTMPDASGCCEFCGGALGN